MRRRVGRLEQSSNTPGVGANYLGRIASASKKIVVRHYNVGKNLCFSDESDERSGSISLLRAFLLNVIKRNQAE